MNKKTKITAITFALLSLVGVIDSFFLTMRKLQHSQIGCSVLEGCDVVLNSVYSMVGPIPLGVFGVIYYLVVFFGALYFLSRPHKLKVFTAVIWITVLGFLFSLYFTYLQAFVLEAYCKYCLMSAGITTIMALLGAKILFIDSKKKGA